MLEKAKVKVEKFWTFGKKTLAALSFWGLVFSLVTIGRLRAAFDYDDTLVDSTPAFNKAFKSGSQPFSTQFWSVVNRNYDLERRKLLSNALAWTLRIFGFKITIIATRPPVEAEALRKEWRHLAAQFVFSENRAARHLLLKQANYVLFFGDSDSDIQAGRNANVFTARIRRSPKSSYKEDYHPGALAEWVIPLSEY